MLEFLIGCRNGLDQGVGHGLKFDNGYLEPKSFLNKIRLNKISYDELQKKTVQC